MQSVLGTLNYYERELGVTGKQAYRQLDSAIRRDWMTGLGFPEPSKRATKQDLEHRRTVLANLPIEKLHSWEVDLEKGFDKLGKSNAQRTPSRSHFRKFYNWCLSQSILVDPGQGEPALKKNPKLNRKKRPKTRRKPCELSAYSLSEKDFNPKLQKEIQDYMAYLTERRVRGRAKKRIRLSTQKQHLRVLCEILGWLHNSCEVALADLSLNLIVPPIDLNNKTAAQEAAEDFANLIEDMATYLQQRGNSSKTIVRKLANLPRLIQYQHRGQYLERHGNDIPVMQTVREIIQYYQDCSQDELEPILIEGKWLELPDFIQKVTLPAFAFTESKTQTCYKRKLPAIADSFQTALLWGCFSLMPPRRPGEWRTCKVAMTCELAEKPKDLQPGEWIWPLPHSRFEEAELEHSYLTRQYIYQDPVTGEKFGTYLGSNPPPERHLERVPLWFKDTPRLAAKSGDAHGHQQVLIMDRRVHRDKRLYDFLEAYLMGYWRDRYGNWVSVSKSSTPPHSGFERYDLRTSMLPEFPKDQLDLTVKVGYLFMGRITGKPFRGCDFGTKLAGFAYNLTGKFVTPHLLRSIYAVHAKETMSRAALESLADAMGHTLQTLESVYDKRRPERKSRFIELTLGPQLDRICAGLPVSAQVPASQPSVDLENLRAMLKNLPASQRQLLLAETS